jgi:hypothetical protein
MSRSDAVRWYVAHDAGPLLTRTGEAVDVPPTMLARVELPYPLTPEVVGALRRILTAAEAEAERLGAA